VAGVSCPVSATYQGIELGMRGFWHGAHETTTTARDISGPKSCESCSRPDGEPVVSLSLLSLSLSLRLEPLCSSVSARNIASRHNRVIVALTFHPLQIIDNCDCSAGSVPARIYKGRGDDCILKHQRQAARTPITRRQLSRPRRPRPTSIPLSQHGASQPSERHHPLEFPCPRRQ
jgi:hypothetical protein